MTSVLYRPLTVSARALSYESPTDPIEGTAPISSRRSPYRIDVNWDPASELSRIRLNSDYAEVGVKPKNRRFAHAGGGF